MIKNKVMQGANKMSGFVHRSRGNSSEDLNSNDQRSSDGLQVVWELGKGKPVNLHIGDKQQDFHLEKLEPGAYLFFAHTNTIIPGGKRLYRYISVNVDARLSHGTKLVQESYRLHSKDNTVAVEFVVPREETGSISISLRLNAPVGPMKVMAKLFRNTGDANHSDEDPLAEAATSIYHSLSFSAIEQELRRESEERKKSHRQRNDSSFPHPRIDASHHETTNRRSSWNESRGICQCIQ
eukprot:TRINITY_DN1533_c1_g1_i3.p1 TRINITY_DN1533_c1_g1~~TRINITY_DN1533_c1_g1_i3.p1  ORF type:complete len:238 (+),score=33.32 TRINITY_DN1533_c1_g1_i3:73-786(+)